MADLFSLVMSCIDSVSDRVRGRSSKRWHLNEHLCSYLAEELLKVSQSLQAKLESGNFKPVRGIQKIVLLHLHAAVKRAQLLVDRCCCETPASWRVAAMTSTDIKEEVITIVLNLHQWTFMLDIAITSVEGRPSKETLEFLKTWEEGYQRLFKKLHSSKHPLQVAALQDHKALLENIAEYTVDEYAYGVYLKSRLAPRGGEVESVPQLKEYIVSRALGQGASGMVLEVTWMGHQCGLKISKGSDKTEATILDRLHHPNIVRFFHYWEVPPPDRNSYMLMELLPSDLQKHILRELDRPSSQSHKKCVGMPFILSVAIDLMLQVAQAMQHVHDQKLTHRDLKTSNILVKPVPESMSELHSQGYLEVKLADFGLAKGYIDSSISEGLTRNMGTTVYGAPEIFGQEETQTHKNFPPKADVWSFGMVCSEILTGRMPFSEERSKAKVHKRIRFEGLRPSFPKDCPDYLQFCIASCWELQPQRRPNFTDLCRMLRHAQLLNLGLICSEDTYTWFGYSDRAGSMNTMSINSTSSAVESTRPWLSSGIVLISNFRNKGRGYKPIQPIVEDSNDHRLQPTREIPKVLAVDQRDNGNPLPQFKGWRNQGEMEEVGRKQARNKEKGESSNAEFRNGGHEATEKVKTHAFPLAQENIDSTIKAAGSALDQFHVSRQVETKVPQGPRSYRRKFLAAMDQLAENLVLDPSLKAIDLALGHARDLNHGGEFKVLLGHARDSNHVGEFKVLLTSSSKPTDPAGLQETLPNPEKHVPETSQKCGAGNVRLLLTTTPPNDKALNPPVLPVLISPGVVLRLAEMAQLLVGADLHQCLKIYRDVRASTLETSLFNLGVERPSDYDIFKMPWELLEGKIKNWIQYLRIAVMLLFWAERQLCYQIWARYDPHREKCFAGVTDSSVHVLLSFGEAIARSKITPEKVFVLLDMYGIMRDLQPEIELVFSGDAAAGMREAWTTLFRRLGQTAKVTLADFEDAVDKDTNKTLVLDGMVHMLTTYVVNYVKLLLEYRYTLNELLFDGTVEDKTSDLVATIVRIMSALQSNLEEKSKLYEDKGLSYIFLMNNIHYMVESVLKSEAKDLLGDDWILKQRRFVQQYGISYQQASWSKVQTIPERVDFQVFQYITISEGGISYGDSGISKSQLEERLKGFNSTFEDLHLRQMQWTIPDNELRLAVQMQVQDILLSAYSSFLKRYSMLIEEIQLPMHLKYSPHDLERMLHDLFEGKSRE